MKTYSLRPKFFSDRERESRHGFWEMSLTRNHGAFRFFEAENRAQQGYATKKSNRESKEREKKRERQRQTMRKKRKKEFRNRASPLESRYPNKYEDNDNDDACCARNRLELIQFSFLFPCLLFSTFLAVFRSLPPPSCLLLSLNRSIQRFLFYPSFCIKPPLFLLLQ